MRFSRTFARKPLYTVSLSYYFLTLVTLSVKLYGIKWISFQRTKIGNMVQFSALQQYSSPCYLTILFRLSWARLPHFMDAPYIICPANCWKWGKSTLCLDRGGCRGRVGRTYSQQWDHLSRRREAPFQSLHVSPTSLPQHSPHITRRNFYSIRARQALFELSAPNDTMPSRSDIGNGGEDSGWRNNVLGAAYV